MEANHTHRIVAVAPTVYQLNSLREFNLNHKPVGNGSYRGEELFYSKEDAMAYLQDRAYKYNNEHNESEEELNEMLADIQHGALTLDAVTAYIEEIEIDEE